MRLPQGRREENCGSVVLCSGRTSAPHDPDIDLQALFPSSLLLTVIDLTKYRPVECVFRYARSYKLIYHESIKCSLPVHLLFLRLAEFQSRFHGFTVEYKLIGFYHYFAPIYCLDNFRVRFHPVIKCSTYNVLLYFPTFIPL